MQFAKAVSTITALNVLGAIVGAVNIALLAYFFGASRPLEVYFAATQIFTLVFSLTQAGKIVDLFLPVYQSLKHRSGPQAAFEGFSVILNWQIVVAVALTLAAVIFAGPLMTLTVPGFSTKDHQLGVAMLVATAPLIMAQLLMAAGQSVLNAESRFGGPETISLVARLVTAVAVVASARSFGIWGAVAGLWAGTLTQALGIGIMLVRLGYRHVWKFRSPGVDHWQLLGQAMQTFWYVGATQIFLTTLNAALSLQPQGVYAIFRYAEQLHSKTYTILMRPISVVFFTAFSAAHAAGSSESRPIVQRALDQGLVLITLAVVGFAAGGAHLVAALLGADQLGAANITIIAQLVLFLYALQYLMLLEQIGRKIAITLGLSNFVNWSYACCQLLSAAIAWLLVPLFGLVGSAMVLALNILLFASAIYGITALRNRDLVMFYSPRAFSQWLAAATIGYGVWVIIDRFMGIVPAVSSGRVENGIVGLVVASVAAMSTFAAALALRNTDAVAFGDFALRLVRRRK